MFVRFLRAQSDEARPSKRSNTHRMYVCIYIQPRKCICLPRVQSKTNKCKASSVRRKVSVFRRSRKVLIGSWCSGSPHIEGMLLASRPTWVKLGMSNCRLSPSPVLAGQLKQATSEPATKRPFIVLSCLFTFSCHFNFFWETPPRFMYFSFALNLWPFHVPFTSFQESTELFVLRHPRIAQNHVPPFECPCTVYKYYRWYSFRLLLFLSIYLSFPNVLPRPSQSSFVLDLPPIRCPFIFSEVQPCYVFQLYDMSFKGCFSCIKYIQNVD